MKQKKITVQSSLINKKYRNEINYFELSSGDTKLYFQKKENIWFCSSQNMPKNFIPCKNDKITGFLDELVKIRSMKKILYKNNNLSVFGLSNENAFIIRYSTNGDTFFEILLGDKDFSGTSRYLMSGKNLTVYETKSDFDSFIYTGLEHWADPYLLSRNFGNKLSKENIQTVVFSEANNNPKIRSNNSESSLYFYDVYEMRHGGCINVNSSDLNKLSEFIFEVGDTSSYLLEVYEIPQNENSLLVKISYDSGDIDKKAFSYEVKISKWTYNKLKNII
ncbi:MAG: DUF4340 domain-containing protein [Treponema sp.]|nr:DUF4340 domain-containing protein [Treponema sp.]